MDIGKTEKVITIEPVPVETPVPEKDTEKEVVPA